MVIKVCNTGHSSRNNRLDQKEKQLEEFLRLFVNYPFSGFKISKQIDFALVQLSFFFF